MGVRLMVAVVCTASLFTLGCTALPQGQVMGFQFDNIVQGNAQRAHAAAEAAAAATCDEAAPFRAKAQFEAEAAAGYAELSTEQVENLRNAMEQQGKAMDFLGVANDRINRARAEFDAAKARFDQHMGSGGPFEGGIFVSDDTIMYELRRDASAYSNAMLALTRAYATAAEDFQLLMATDGEAISAFMPEGTEFQQLGDDIRQASDALMDDAVMVATAEYTVPSNMNQMIADFKWPAVMRNENDYSDEYESVQEAMINLYNFGQSVADEDHRSGFFPLWDQVTEMMGATQASAQAAMQQASNNIAQLADVTDDHADAAEVFAQQAAEACGVAIQQNPFGPNNPPPYPDWSETFWDYSSP